MSNEVLIGLIVGGAGAALALLALLLAAMAKVAASRAAQDLQLLQQQIAQDQSARWMQDQQMENQIKLRLAFLDGIRKLSDELTRMMHVKKGTVKKEALYKAVSDIGRQFSKLCDDHAEKLNEVEQAAVLQARDTAVETSYQTRSMLDEIDDPADLSSTHRADMGRLRAELNDSQSILRGSIQDQLINRIFGESRGE